MNTTSPHLTRSTDDRMLGGVAGGLGSYFGVDPVLFRVGFAVATLLSGVGAIAYIAMLLAVPRDDAPTGAARPASA
jgi:phage shock protein PspC (stress-responsive transcriptional regulator)